jgi:hypothetical protein
MGSCSYFQGSYPWVDYFYNGFLLWSINIRMGKYVYFRLFLRHNWTKDETDNPDTLFK